MKRQAFAIGTLAALLIAGLVMAGDTETKAVAALVKLGGKVLRDDMKPGQPVVKVYLTGPKVTDVELKEIAAFKELQILDLRRTKVTDAGLKNLAPLTQLQELYLIGVPVTDAGLKEVAPLKQLQKLFLVGSQVTDKGLKNLAALKQLQEVYLDSINVTKTGRDGLKKALPNCTIN